MTTEELADMSELELAGRIESIQASIDEQEATVMAYLQELRQRQAAEFIAQHGITISQVSRPSTSEDDLFLFVRELASAKALLPWTEWNGKLHRTLDVLNGKLIERRYVLGT